MSPKTKMPRKKKPVVPKRTHKWVVMKLQDWSGITVFGHPVIVPKEGPSGYIAVFDTREQAIAYNNGSAESVHQISPL